MMIFGAMAAANCSGGDPQRAAVDRKHATGISAPAPTATASPTVSNPSNASLPFDRYLTPVDDYIELNYASRLLANDCMTRFGYHLDPGHRMKLTARRREQSNHFGIVDEAAAARGGYHVDPAHASDYQPHKNGSELTDAQAFVMFGDPTKKGDPPREGLPKGGCNEEGLLKVGWNLDEDMWLQTIEGDAVHRTFADPRALSVMADWSSCMKASGYRYDTPDDASQDPRWRTANDDGPATKAEKNAAVTDVRCKRKINYVGRLTTILVAVQQQIVENNLERLESVRQHVQNALKNAAAVLGGR